MHSALVQLTACLLLFIWSSGQSCSNSATICAADAAIELNPKYEVLEGTEVVWQKPSTAAAAAAPTGILLAFHGCGHAATDWFPQTTSCNKCTGLPVEVRITSTALSRGYMVVAVTSRDRSFGKCWSVPHKADRPSADVHSVTAVLKKLLPREGLVNVPLYALGASSGGAFVLTLPAFIPLAGVCSQIMALPPDWYAEFLTATPAAAAAAAAAAVKAGSSSSTAAAPVLFVHMPRDERTAELVAKDVELRTSKGLASHVIEVKPQAVTPDFLTTHMPELAINDAASKLVKLFKDKQLLDDFGMLKNDPRNSDWRDVVKASDIPLPGASEWSLAPDKCGLSEVLNVAWAGHEIVSDTTADMLEWFEKQPRS